MADASTLALLEYESTLALNNRSHDISTISFSPDGTTIVAGSFHNSLTLWGESLLVSLEGIRLRPLREWRHFVWQMDGRWIFCWRSLMRTAIGSILWASHLTERGSCRVRATGSSGFGVCRHATNNACFSGANLCACVCLCFCCCLPHELGHGNGLRNGHGRWGRDNYV